MFTGSTATGRRVAGRAGERLIPCSLELGGKDPMIVCADADLDRAAAGRWGLRAYAARCACGRADLRRAAVYEPFVDGSSSASSALRQGAPGEGGRSDIGAMTMPEQMEIVAATSTMRSRRAPGS